MYEKVHMHIYAVIEVDVDVLGTKSGNFSPFKKNHQIKLFGGEVEYRDKFWANSGKQMDYLK